MNYCNECEYSVCVSDEPCLLKANKEYSYPQWIPVTERLPKVGKKVLITDRYGKIQIGRTHLTGRGYAPYWEYLEESGTDYWSKVTALAWMPLPDPYEVEE